MQRTIFGGVVAVAAGFLLAFSAQAQDDHLKCYKVKDPVRLRGPNPSWLDLTGPAFGSEDCRIVGGFRLFCTPVAKTVTQSIERKVIPGPWTAFTPDPIDGAETFTQDKLCYKVKCQPSLVPDPNAPLALFDQFGNREVTRPKPFLLCGPAEQGVRFVIPLMDASQEVPPNASLATGECTGTLVGSTLDMTCTHDVVAPTAAHVHVGGPGVAGGIVFPFASGTSPITGTWAMTIGDIGNLTTGQLYVNVHSNNCGTCPGGEIRGQWEQAP